jgi:hypothetical protein
MSSGVLVPAPRGSSRLVPIMAGAAPQRGGFVRENWRTEPRAFPPVRHVPQSASGPGFPLPTIFQELPGYPSALEIDETLMPAVLRFKTRTPAASTPPGVTMLSSLLPDNSSLPGV